MQPLRLRYQTYEFGNSDIHIRSLRDNQEFHDPHGVAADLGISSANWSLFGIVWPSSQVLAHLMDSYATAGKRILEVGCGIGLASLLLNSRNADITATDYHPSAQEFLGENTELNQDRAIPFIRTGWDDEESDLGNYDLIIGSDLLYEAGHVDQLSTFIDAHAAKQCEVVLVDPGRGNHAKFSKRMVTLGYSHHQQRPESPDYLDQPFKGWVLHYQR